MPHLMKGLTIRAKIIGAHLLVGLGKRTSPATLHMLDTAMGCLRTGSWVRSHSSRCKIVASRQEVFEVVAREVRGRRVLYLEFGVWEGASMRMWSQLLAGETASLHGFDSFEGLPEDWHSQHPTGTFSTAGAVPNIDDPRIRFFPGRFENTLVHYEPPPHDVTIMNLDADLYSSTKCV